MGQYYYLLNLDKKQYLHPHRFGDGLKLLEFGASGGGTMTGLAILLADGNGRGGGDLHSEHPIIGTWAGDRIIVAGDYADEVPDDEGKRNWHMIAGDEFEEISAPVLEAMRDDRYLSQDLDERLKHYSR